MFDDIKNKLRGWLSKLGIIKDLQTITEHKKVDISEDHYERLSLWQDLYRGFPSKDEYEYNYQAMGKKQSRRLLTLNLPKVISDEMATLIFNEKVQFNVDNERFDKYLQGILKRNKFYRNMQAHYERGLAMGGMIIKPYLGNDGEIAFSFVSASNFFPISWNSDSIREGVFTHRFKRGKFSYTHLEWHEWEGKRYRVTNELYKSTNPNHIGVRTSLSEAFEDLEPVVYFNSLKQDKLFVYIKPNIANNFDVDSPLGVSIFANAIDTIHTIDRMFDSLNREFKLGKKRIFVSSNMIKAVPDSNGNLVRFFDTEDETYEAFDGDMDNNDITETKIELRVDEHTRAIEVMLNILATQTGFSANTFSFSNGGVKTATEVVSEQSKTFKTKQSHEVFLAEALEELVDLIAYLTQAFNLESVPKYNVKIHFDDSIAEDKTAETLRMKELVMSKLMPKVKAIAEIHGLSEEEAQEWLNMINKENQTINALDVGMFGDE